MPRFLREVRAMLNEVGEAKGGHVPRLLHRARAQLACEHAQGGIRNLAR